jgi:single-stranded-DNA-specific exonuclease
LRAVDRVLKARQLKEKIVVYGDYDADGVCSSAIIISLLKELGIEHDIYIPYRDIEGYGLNLTAVQKIIKQGLKF